MCAAATTGLAITTVLVSPAVAAPGGPAEASRLAPVPVARQLDNPRQLGLTDDGVLVIAESGTGGDDCAVVGGEQVCVGTTGAVSIVRRPSKAQGVTAERVVTGLLSEAGPSGIGATGNDAASARSLDRIFIAKDVDVPDGINGLPEEQEGSLLRAAAGQPAVVVADIRAYESANDPDGQGVESNPYGVLDLGDRVLVADAAGNDILAVDGSGEISVFAVLPNVSGGACDTRPNQGGNFCDPVPTSLTFSRDGDVIVAGLGSLVPGAGRVWELDRQTGAIQQTWTGFTGVTGAAQDQAGNLYVSELFGGADGAGQVVFVPKNGARATLPVPSPAGVVVDQPGNVYVSAYSLSPGTGLGAPGTDGQVWRLTKRSF
ncbi:ScyD/ScyE family protein [Blastococcus sp. VKM Ac-2987]|uniref:ScyD/ScyE family protein n=1 Tax=Blastococcus sp. VKM Ac-2987 TaxID=3004141 RepID=UPI0022AB5BA2|nr:ScyD/ScyE family protein [Blastococcus sp. VKM Ac-2987]MCZ2860710.1 ScyD/ScyE family protein [Blastococcus sp. VKM Ac-2987]